MDQYKKLFDKSEIEYITPFMKLWMSFNNWYKKDLDNIRKDRGAINYYKGECSLKTHFKRLLEGRSIENEKFQDALYFFIKNQFNNYEDDTLVVNPSPQTVTKEALSYISQAHKEYYYREDAFDKLYSQTIENIYQIRCKLVHGDFDIEDITFLQLIENIYNVFYPLMEKVINTIEDKIYFCKNKKGTNAKAKFIEGKMIVLKESKICEAHVPSYSGILSRYEVLRKNAVNKDNVFTLDKDIEFDSPSAASSFCLGKNSNGWDDWKNKNNQSMNEILR